MESITSLGPFLIPIFGIIGGCAVAITIIAVAITIIVVRHLERVAKIERGIDPDAPRR